MNRMENIQGPAALLDAQLLSALAFLRHQD